MAVAIARGEREPLLNIGQVLELLTPDFGGLISISKLRGLEDDGLIKPGRTASGYRKFSATDVERLRYILRMQRDHYLPRRVIREHLDAMDRGLEPPAPDPVVPTVPKVAIGADGLPAPESFRRTDQLRLSRKELIKVAEIDEVLLGQLEDFALITPSPTGHYDTDALVIAQSAKELADFGLEPRHLRAFRTAADREVGLIEQVVASTRGGRDEAVSEIAALSVRLHATLVKAGLRRL